MTKNEMNSVIEYLEAAADTNPKKLAVIDQRESITYEKLLELTRSAGTLVAGKCQKSAPVVVFGEKSYLSLACMLGVVQGGCFYVPLNPEQPKERVEKILEVLQPKVMLVSAACMERAKDLAFSGEIVSFDTCVGTKIEDDLLRERRRKAHKEDPLYGIFTSGSTGTPKCVLVSHQCVLDFIPHFIEETGLLSTDVFANQAPFDFDVSVKDIYSSLALGATILLIPKELFALPTCLLDYICDNHATVLIWAVSAMCQISGLKGFDYRIPTDLRRVMFSGESMPIKQLKIWREALPELPFVNLYGPTEITCNCTYYWIAPGEPLPEKLPIGKAFGGREVFLLDERGQRVTQPGISGEICVTGESISLGYYHNTEQTKKSFILYGPEKKRTYRTGDMAYWNPKNQLVFDGRKDFQIKHMGHRIELEEIENALNSLAGIVRSCCLFDREKNKIICFYVGDVEKTQLKKQLKLSLPGYMVPQKLCSIDQMPMNKNGKMDRNQLMTWAKEGLGS